MDKIDIESVKKMYDEMDEVWSRDSKWYMYTYNTIQGYLKSFEKKNKDKINNDTIILNAGSAGNTYGISGKHYHVDISKKHLENIPNAVICSIESLPFEDESFDVCICVGSVINYCDAMCALNEIYRVLKRNGILILDYDQSKSFEFIGTKHYSKNAEIVETFNDRIWIYSEKYIDTILKKCPFKIINKQHYHCLSPLAYRFLKDENKASKYAMADKIFSKLPIIKNISCNVILSAQKF